MYDPKPYIVSLTITTGLVPQVFEVLEVRTLPPPPPSLGTYFNTKTFT